MTDFILLVLHKRRMGETNEMNNTKKTISVLNDKLTLSLHSMIIIEVMSMPTYDTYYCILVL